MQGAESQLGLEEDGEVEKPAPGQYCRRIRANCSGGAEKRALWEYNQYLWGEGVVQSEGGEKCKRKQCSPQATTDGSKHVQLGIENYPV